MNTYAQYTIERKWPAFLLRGWLLTQLFYFSLPIYRALFKRKRKAWKWTLDKMQGLPFGSFGHGLAHFMKSNGYEVLTKFENHDACHVLLNYQTDIIGEVSMQFCLYGNGKRSPYLLGVIVLGWLFFPECWDIFRTAKERGKVMKSFHQWNFEHLLHEPLNLLKAMIEDEMEEEFPLFI